MTAPARRGGTGLGLLATARAGNWWSSKLPPLLSVAFAQVLRHPAPAGEALPALAAVTIALCAVAWHAHVVNDVCDIDDDGRSGKANRMVGLSALTRWTLLLVLPLIGILMAAGPFVHGPMPTWVVAVNFAIFALYSVPPIRLKTRRWWGVAADALGAHGVPTLFVLSAMPGGLGRSGVDGLFVVAALACSMAAGLRGIIAHQFADRRADALAELQTMGTTSSLVVARTLVLRVLLPIEACALVLVVGLTVPFAPLLLVAAALYVTVEITKVRRSWKLPLFEPAASSNEPYLPLVNNDAYELWLPNTLALQLAAQSFGFILLPLMQIGLFLAGMRQRAKDIARLSGEQADASFHGSDASWNMPAHGFEARVVQLPPRDSGELPSPERPATPPIVIGATYWVVNGVNIFSANLARGLNAVGESAQVLLTESATRLISFREARMPRADDVPFVELPVKGWEPWGAHWGEMIRYLESMAPCIYIPNSDWRHSSVCPLLSNRVGIVGVVHSDDPLHYDHVRRLGASWNAIVTVSRALAERTAELMPAIADRIVTIPIGVSIPSVKPHRVAAAGPLRIVYHGALKQHQKRVLDLPRIVEALAARHVPVQLTIAGGGPDEKELRERSQALVDRGLMEFSGVVAHEAIPALLDQHDVYLLASEFEGMPNALVEAMGRGLVPVVTRVASGSTELVRDGETGFLVPVGDIDAFAARLSLLHRDADLRLRLSDAAFDAVSGSYRVEDMVADYRELFAEVLHDVKTGRYRRERKELSHPPAQVAGVSLFPEPLPYHVPGVGRFPREQDYRAFRHRVRMAPAEAEVTWLPELRGAPSPAGALPEELTVIIGSPIWARNGVNLHSLKLVRGLTKRGIAARLLLTEEATDLVTVEEPRLDEPGDVAVDRLPVSRDQGWGAHWGATIRYLEEHAPCIYLPTYDWRHACVVPRLSPAIQVVGNLSSADPLSEEQAHRLGAYMSAIVTHDAETAALFQVAHPEPGGRLVVIPEGIEIPDEVPQALNRRPTGDILICASTLGGREAELVPILHGIGNRFDTARAILLGSADHPERRVPPVPEAVAGLALPLTWPAPKSVFGAHTVILSWLASDHVPTELVEAMGWGCIPFLIDCGGPSHTLFHHGENCYVFERGNAQAIADRMAELERSPRLRASMSASAHLSAHEWFTPFDTVLDQYVALFGRVVVASRTGGFVRPTGPMLPPPAAVNGISVFPVALDYEVADVGRFSSVQDHEAFSQQLAGAGGREAPPRSEDHDGEGER